MRLLALTDPGCAASTRYRVAQFDGFLKAGGVTQQILPWPRHLSGLAALLNSVAEADVVLIQRYLPTLSLLRQIRQRARRLVYDFDDAVIYRESTRQKPRLMLRRWWRFRQMMRSCDAVTAGNGYLSGLARRYAESNRVFVLPTTLDLEPYDREKPPAAEPGPVLGWIGGHWTLPYLERLRRPLERLSDIVPGLTVRVIADKLPDLGKTRVELIPWDAATEARELKQLRVGLAPLPRDAWTHGKCGLRLLQYLAAGIPAVASPVGTQAELIHAGAALPASSEADWLQAIQQVLNDRYLTADLVAAGREIVREQFCAPVWAGQLRAFWCGSNEPRA